uniref:Secreted protein n=1 Tax=Ascaris lumbricoides TaxID=6252 RepID=A0A0M3I9Z8_ASCLU
MNSIKFAILLFMSLVCEAGLRVESNDERWGLDEPRSINKYDRSILEAERGVKDLNSDNLKMNARRSESTQKISTLGNKRRHAKDLSRNKSKSSKMNKVSDYYNFFFCLLHFSFRK